MKRLIYFQNYESPHIIEKNINKTHWKNSIGNIYKKNCQCL